MKSSIPNACIGQDKELIKDDVNTIIPLDILEDKQEATIVRIDAGQTALTRLCHLGLTPGVIVKKITGAPFQGPIEIRVRDTLLAIGRGLARKVLVIRKRDENAGSN
nr:FeoA family protein [Candidatus Sigynarchaeota archaeon]